VPPSQPELTGPDWASDPEPVSTPDSAPDPGPSCTREGTRRSRPPALPVGNPCVTRSEPLPPPDVRLRTNALHPRFWNGIPAVASASTAVLSGTHRRSGINVEKEPSGLRPDGRILDTDVDGASVPVSRWVGWSCHASGDLVGHQRNRVGPSSLPKRNEISPTYRKGLRGKAAIPDRWCERSRVELVTWAVNCRRA
jgi:hypothetical protein